MARGHLTWFTVQWGGGVRALAYRRQHRGKTEPRGFCTWICGAYDPIQVISLPRASLSSCVKWTGWKLVFASSDIQYVLSWESRAGLTSEILEGDSKAGSLLLTLGALIWCLKSRLRFPRFFSPSTWPLPPSTSPSSSSSARKASTSPCFPSSFASSLHPRVPSSSSQEKSARGAPTFWQSHCPLRAPLPRQASVARRPGGHPPSHTLHGQMRAGKVRNSGP